MAPSFTADRKQLNYTFILSLFIVTDRVPVIYGKLHRQRHGNTLLEKLISLLLVLVLLSWASVSERAGSDPVSLAPSHHEPFNVGYLPKADKLNLLI